MARVSRKNLTAPVISCPAPRVFKTAVYARLSVEDARKKRCDSIGAQKALLLRYIDEHPDLALCGVYEDINRTGTNFNRPAFARMIEDIRAGLADCVIVKDLSRFGRSFWETCNYLERVFPLLGVRFIAVGDRYDSLTARLDESGLVVPVKNLMNEIYARDISKKTQAGFEAKGKRGEFCGAFAPYGYLKSGTSFVVDEEAAGTVRQIFAWLLDGQSDAEIAGRLNCMKILPPNRYRFEKNIIKAEKYSDATRWHASAVRRISRNPAYTGVMVSGKRRSGFMRGVGSIQTDKSEWIIIENAHAAIISKELFDAVGVLRESHGRSGAADG